MKTKLKATGFTIVSTLALTMTAMSASAGYNSDNAHIDYARVTHVEPVYETVVRSLPKEQCWNERVRHSQRYARHYGESATPTLLGALIGGAIGNELGHHKRNKQVGAVVGGILGGSIGRDIGRNANRHHHDDHYSTVERCKVRYESYEEQALVGYDVTYRYRGNEYNTHTVEHPGEKLRVRVSVQPAI